MADVLDCPPERLEELFALRARVWIDEGADPRAFPAGQWSDAHDPHRQHWMVLDAAGAMIAGASLAVHTSMDDVDEAAAYRSVPFAGPGLVAAPARVVVVAAHRGAGLAQSLLDRQDEAARAAGAVIAVRQASPAMRRLLERRGWRYHGAGPADARFPGVAFSVMSRLW
jgi:GNAT superfamily N-acetyltransferase